MWVEMNVLWWNCSVLCRMYERGKEVIREWLWQPGLSRAPRLVFFKLRSSNETSSSYAFSQCNHLLWERRRDGRLQKHVRRGLPPHWDRNVLSLFPPRSTWALMVFLPPLPRGTRAPASLSSACLRSGRVLRHTLPLGREWGLEWKVVGCGCEVTGCGWVGGVLWCEVGGRRGHWSDSSRV